jgi:hypothetical protein
MPTFVHPSLLWGLPIIALPVLIHLINIFRHRRVEWAAMEFLLISQKKNRTWVLLKQLLLMLMRMAAIATVVMLVAQPMLQRQLGGLLGGTKTHHVVLLDDSFSMSDHWDDTSAFQEAKRVIERIGAEAAKNVQAQAFTLLPFSHAKRDRLVRNDLINHRIGTDFAGKLADTLKNTDVSQTDAGPLDALRALDQLLGEPQDERRILYIVSDFRMKDWSEPADLAKLLKQWQATQGDKIRLVNCVDQARPNLAVESLKSEQGIRAAGVPWFMKVAVTNYSSTPAKNVSVSLAEDGQSRPGVIFREIPPGRTVKERFQVNFSTEGPHEITARLDSDAVAIDNYRFYSTDLPNDVPVLIVIGDAQSQDAQFLSWAAAPGGSVRTGLRPQVDSSRALNPKQLENYGAIVLTDIERLDTSAVTALEQYAASGGGVAFFLGNSCQTKSFNDDLYRNGNGLFPVPLGGHADLAVDRLQTAPDVEVEKHFIFRIFAELRNTFLQTVLVYRYFSLPENWHFSEHPTVQLIAGLRNGAPLVLEKAYGKGRVVAFLTTAAPTWNNWAKNPSFVVVVQDLMAYLSERTGTDASMLVGEHLELTLDPAKYQKQVRFVVPSDKTSPPIIVDAPPNAEGKLIAAISETDFSGVYQAALTRSDNSSEIRRYAFNVNSAEGNLAALDKGRLAEHLKDLNYEYEQASMFQSAADETAGDDFSRIILYALVILLIGEQILARSASYHLGSSRAVPSAGGVR